MKTLKNLLMNANTIATKKNVGPLKYTDIKVNRNWVGHKENNLSDPRQPLNFRTTVTIRNTEYVYYLNRTNLCAYPNGIVLKGDVDLKTTKIGFNHLFRERNLEPLGCKKYIPTPDSGIMVFTWDNKIIYVKDADDINCEAIEKVDGTGGIRVKFDNYADGKPVFLRTYTLISNDDKVNEPLVVSVISRTFDKRNVLLEKELFTILRLA